MLDDKTSRILDENISHILDENLSHIMDDNPRVEDIGLLPPLQTSHGNRTSQLD